MHIFLKEFLDSQLFGIILGAVLTGGFTCLIDYFKFSRNEKQFKCYVFCKCKLE